MLFKADGRLYLEIEDKGYTSAVEYFADNPEAYQGNKNQLTQAAYHSLAEADIKHAIFEAAWEHGGKQLTDLFFKVNAETAWNEDLTGRKAIEQTAFSTVLSDPRLQLTIGALVEYLNPVLANMTKKAGSGDKARIRRYTEGSTPGEWIIDTDTITEDTGTPSNVNFTHRTMGAQGKMSRFMIAVGRSIGDVLAEEITFKTWAFRDTLENAIIRGSNTTDTKQIDGLDILIPASQVVAMTPGTGGAVLTKAKMDEFIDKSTMGIDMIIASKRGARDVNVLEESYRRYNMDNKVTVAGGMRVNSWDGVPILRTTNILNTLLFTDTALTAYTGSTETELIGINNTETWLEFLTPVTMMPLARTTSQSVTFEIFTDMVTVIRNYQASARLTGIISA